MNEDNIILDSDSRKLIIEHLYTVEDYSTFNIKVQSGEFAGASHFCIPKDSILFIVEALSKMRDNLTGYSEISDSDSDSHINLEIDKLGHICMTGQIGGSHEEHSMKFKLITDQTILSGLIQKLRSTL